jgi:hypothetical protein
MCTMKDKLSEGVSSMRSILSLYSKGLQEKFASDGYEELH